VRVAGTDGRDASERGGRRNALIEFVAAPDEERSVSLEGHDVAETSGDGAHASEGGSGNPGTGQTFGGTAGGEFADATKVVLPPTEDATTATEDDDVVGTDFNLRDGTSLHPRGDGSLTLAIKAPGC